MMELSEMELERIVAGKQPRATNPITLPMPRLAPVSLACEAAPRSAVPARETCPGGVCGVN